MREGDLKAFSALLDDVAALLMRPGQALNATQRAMYFRSLAAYPLEEVRAALDAHIRDPQRGRFFPMPADILAQIEGLVANDGRPGAEEAWAVAMRASDEAETVVWTGEAAQAWAIARPVLDAGDEVGARMAFKEAYNRLVDQARRQRVPASWQASLGHDPRLRDEAIRQAVTAGRLPVSELPALPAPSMPLLALEAPKGSMQERAVQALRELGAKLRSGLTESKSADAAARERTAALKARAAELAQKFTTDGAAA